ncbi:MAG: hypothetical protein ACN4GM_15920 [Gammaproteobacteria bacterium]
MFKLSENNLKKLWKQNQFIVPDDKWIFFGIRGSMPADDGNYELASDLVIIFVNYAAGKISHMDSVEKSW